MTEKIYTKDDVKILMFQAIEKATADLKENYEILECANNMNLNKVKELKAELKNTEDSLERWIMECIEYKAENEKLKIQRDGWQTIANKEVNKNEKLKDDITELIGLGHKTVSRSRIEKAIDRILPKEYDCDVSYRDTKNIREDFEKELLHSEKDDTKEGNDTLSNPSKSRVLKVSPSEKCER